MSFNSFFIDTDHITGKGGGEIYIFQFILHWYEGVNTVTGDVSVFQFILHWYPVVSSSTSTTSIPSFNSFFIDTELGIMWRIDHTVGIFQFILHWYWIYRYVKLELYWCFQFILHWYDSSPLLNRRWNRTFNSFFIDTINISKFWSVLQNWLSIHSSLILTPSPNTE